MFRLACLAAAVAIAACAPAGTTGSDDVPAPAAGSATAAPVAGGSCNVETGQPGPGEGVYERAEDGGLVCVSQEPGMERPSVDPGDLGTDAPDD